MGCGGEELLEFFAITFFHVFDADGECALEAAFEQRGEDGASVLGQGACALLEELVPVVQEAAFGLEDLVVEAAHGVGVQELVLPSFGSALDGELKGQAHGFGRIGLEGVQLLGLEALAVFGLACDGERGAQQADGFVECDGLAF